VVKKRTPKIEPRSHIAYRNAFSHLLPAIFFEDDREQEGQLSQTNRVATWEIVGKNRPVSAKSVHLTLLYSAKTFRNAEPFRHTHQLSPIFK